MSTSNSAASGDVSQQLTKSGKFITLEAALENGADFDSLSPGLQHQLLNAHTYKHRYLKHAINNNYSYFDLPGWLATQLTEKRYFDDFIAVALESLQLYPYAHIERVVFYTAQTPLSYYTTMIGELLKREKSYDTLPNFTAVDILNLLGIGRNQFLNTTKEVRSKLWWKVNRSFVKKHLPAQLLPSVNLDPFWRVKIAVASLDEGRKLCETEQEIAVMRTIYNESVRPMSGGLLQLARAQSFNSSRFADGKRDYFYACELPFNEVNSLHRKGVIIAAFEIEEHECVVVPPLQRFVMNRTSDDPQERLLYRILATIDDRTPLETLAGMLHINNTQVCDAVAVYVRLGLAKRKQPPMPIDIADRRRTVHETWAWMVQLPDDADSGGGADSPTAAGGVVAAAAAAGGSPAMGGGRRLSRRPRYLDSMKSISTEDSDPAAGSALGFDESTSSLTGAQHTATGSGSSSATTPSHGSHPQRRVALLFDASLTGYLMMTNLSTDPTFKQHAVTLFEAGKLTDEALGPFLQKLDDLQLDGNMFFGDDAAKYYEAPLCLRYVLHNLRDSQIPHCVAATDMLKIEAINELEATTRYTVMCRNYGCFFVVSPIAQPPLLDIMLEGIYGASTSLVPSPWMLLYCYSKLRSGPSCALLRFGERLPILPPLFRVRGKDAALRLVPLRGDAETHVFPAMTALMALNDLLVQRPLFVVVIPQLPPGAVRHKVFGLPFVGSDADMEALIARSIAQTPVAPIIDHHRAVIETLRGAHSLGYCKYEVVTVPSSCEGSDSREVVSVQLVDIGFGIPLTDFELCKIVMKSLPEICDMERMDQHNANMRDLATDIGMFIDCYAHSTSKQRDDAALQSSANVKRNAALHTPLPSCASTTVPFPSISLQYNGAELSTLKLE